MCQSHWSAKYRSRSPGQGTCRVSTLRRSTIQGLTEGLTVEGIWKGDVKGVKVNGARNISVKITESRYLRSDYIEKPYARFGGCRHYIEETLNVLVKCVKRTGAQNIGQGNRVKIPAESVHLGEALCKVWWLEVLHLRRSGTLT